MTQSLCWSTFDYHGTLIKEVQFEKTTEELAYQLIADEDVLGRVWALDQLSTRAAAATTSAVEKQRITTELANAVTGDKFWGVRLNATTALAEVKDPAARPAMVAATRDQNARVRAGAVTALAKSKDPALASLYEKLLNDHSYAVIKAAALALGETRVPSAYDALGKLINTTSWRDNIRVSALAGLAELQDKRAVDVALRYADKGNPIPLRAAALRLLGKVGGDNPKAFSLIAAAATKAFATSDFNLTPAAGEALVSLGDPRGLALLEEISHEAGLTPRQKEQISQYQERLRKASAGGGTSGASQP